MILYVTNNEYSHLVVEHMPDLIAGVTESAPEDTMSSVLIPPILNEVPEPAGCLITSLRE